MYVCGIVIIMSIIVVNAGGSANTVAIKTGVSPLLELGSHLNSVGIRADFKCDRKFNSFNAGMFIESSSRFDITCLSIPGSQYQVSFFTGPFLIFGKGTTGCSPWTASPALRRHTIKFKYIAHLDNRKTSQVSGSLEYLLSSDHFSAGLLFEDDFFALQNRDAYRTGALEAALWIDPPFLPFSFSLFGGTKIWTGPAIGNKSAEEVYDLSSSRYGNYSAGILYIGAGVNTVRLSIGWDSEKIRNAIQNSFHRAIDDGAIPILPNREERFFFNITIGVMGSLY
jgi:Bacterial toxin 23